MNITSSPKKTNFGYSKALNKKLKKRLEIEPSTPVNRTIASVNKQCNKVEEEIVKLEANNSTEKNETAINILLDYLLEAKTFLCTIVDKCFPDLNFLKASADSYDMESVKKIEENDPDEDGLAQIYKETRSAFIWRDIMVDNLSNLIDDNSKTYSASTDYLFQERAKSGVINGIIEPEEKTGGIIEKYIPDSDSPKSLDDVVGLKKAVADVEDFIIFPLEHPVEALERKKEYGIKIPGFIIFYGPSGCGKTMLAQAIAAQSGCDMYCLDLSKVGSVYVNETSSNIRKAFEQLEAEAKKSQKPVVLFMDEMDSLAEKRMLGGAGSKEDNKVVNTLLPLISAAKAKNIIIIGATNMYNFLDPAIVRRAGMKQYIGLPDSKEISTLLVKELSKFKKGKNFAGNKKLIAKLSKELKGYSPSNIIDIIMSASVNAYRCKRELREIDFIEAIKQGSFEKINEKEYKLEQKANKIGFEP